jgi:replicative DNA helicase
MYKNLVAALAAACVFSPVFSQTPAPVKAAFVYVAPLTDAGWVRQLAKELNVPVIAISQLSRAVEQRADKKPQLSDLRESGAIEQDADVVMFIHRNEADEEDVVERGIVEIIVAKHRNGPTGSIKLAFMENYTKFANLAKNV